MNRRKVIIGLLLLSIGALFVLSNFQRLTFLSSISCKTHHDTYQVINFSLPQSQDTQQSSLKLLVADSPAKWEYGLMKAKNKIDICGNDGMIFQFPLATPQTFWNKNTLVDLQIYWMRNRKVVGKEELPAITNAGLTTISSPEAVDAVIEVVVQ